jgi:hypothetical protein
MLSRVAVAASALVCLLASSCADDAGVAVSGPAPSSDARGRVGYPLAGPPPNGFATRKDVGEVFTNGQLVVFNAGGDDIELLAVEPQLTGKGLVYLGARVAGLHRRLGSTQDEPGFPPTGEPLLGRLRRVAGLVVPAGRAADRRGVELLLGFRVTGRGRATVRGVTVVYRSAGRTHRQTWTSTMAVCAPRSPRVRCRQEYAGTGFR